MQMQSDQIDQLLTSLSKAQGEMGHALKDSTNPHFKSKYADLASVWDACRYPLSKNGLSVSQMVQSLDDGKMQLVTLLGHSSGQWIKSCMSIILDKMTPQAMGSCLTYYRRYSLTAICGIAQDDDDGNAATQSYNLPKLITTQQLIEINDSIADDLELRGKILSTLIKRGIKRLDLIPVEMYDNIMNFIRISKSKVGQLENPIDQNEAVA